jgi:pimeloyl-ACP methyl ester carboxylesterase
MKTYQRLSLFWHQFSNRNLDKSDPERTPAFITRDFLHRLRSEDWVIQRTVTNMITMREVMDGKLASVTMPVLIVWGKQDRIAFNRKPIARFVSGSISPARQRSVYSAPRKRYTMQWNKVSFFSNRTAARRPTMLIHNIRLAIVLER